MRARLTIDAPVKGRTFLVGKELEVVVTVEVQEPWFRLDDLGRVISTVDGATRTGIAFESRTHDTVRSPVTGIASVHDTRVDVHSEAGLGQSAGAGRGHEVRIRCGDLDLSFGHLERGSGRAGAVRRGDTIGRMGNTGRCVDGCGRTFTHVQLLGQYEGRSPRDFAVPLELVALDGGKPLEDAIALPEGEARVPRFRVARLRVTRDRFPKKETVIEVQLRREHEVLTKEQVAIKVAIG